MSEPNPENLTNVEDDQPEAPVAQQPEPAPPQAAPDAPADPDDAESVEIQGGKYVPLSALRNVRDELKSLKGQASQAQTLAQQVANLQGQLQSYQHVAQTLQQQRQAPPPDPREQVNPNALKFAQRLDLYRQDASGQAVPDTDKAQELLSIIEQVAEQKARANVEPIQKRAAMEASARNYQWAVAVKDPHGRQVDQHVINQIWQAFPPEYTANPQVAQTLVYTALGMDRMRQQAQVPPPAGPPVHTEGVGGNPRTRPAMTDLERRIAADRGVDEKKWGKLTEGYRPGHTTILED